MAAAPGTGGGGGGTGTGGTGGTGGGGTGDPGTGGGGTGGTGGGGTGGTGGGTGGGTTDPDPVTPYIPTSPVVGCPSTDYLGEAYTTTGEDLEDETVRLDASGGGQTPLDSCPGIPGTGYVYANPTFSLYLSEMDDFERFVVRIHSDCDTTLLLRDAQGNYHFDDDSGPDLNGRLRLRDMEPLNGRVDIYVGTFDGDTCNDVQVRLILRD
ncbi:hypothetical protein roselon_02401 [Roseibacterium elongatum DSM 19469]|uniref:Uncharacterized protein n=1 Tax=Roseicyclus elongatus DSM 19469 TaxID=1294273 RepID=W8RU32_9RHOB|nr:hypothetical protein [Roseibacterium elongatum]AHM04728.1 hypothetical protein roselon_02401 [Roseibacterium elongatum DSM 19469]